MTTTTSVLLSIFVVIIMATILIYAKGKIRFDLTGLTDKMPSGKSWWKPLVGLGLIHLTLAVFFHDKWWYSEYILNKWAFIAQTAIALIYIFLREDIVERGKSKTVLTTWGKVAIMIVLSGLMIRLFIDPWLYPQKTEKLQATASGRPSPTGCPDVGPLGPIPSYNAEGERRAREFWSKHTKNEEDLKMMMTVVLPRESQFNHFENDGSQALVGRENCNDRGLHQINLTSWYKEVQTYPDREVTAFGKTVKIKDIKPEEKEGNYMAALYLYNQTGLSAWKASIGATTPVVAKETLTIIAPTGGEWSEVINVSGRHFNWSRLGDQITQMKVNGSQVYDLDPKNTGRLNLPGNIKTLEYRSMTDTEEKFKIEF